MRLQALFRLFLVFVCITVAAILVISLIISYESLIDGVVRMTGYSEDKRVVLEEMLTPSRIRVLQVILLVILVVFSISARFSQRIYTSISWFLKECWTTIKNILADVSSPKAVLILALPILASIFIAWVTPVSHDESFTYVTFTNKPFYYCMIFYPYPNNHVLNSALTNLTEFLPFLPILFKLRLTALFVSASMWIIAYSFIKRTYSEKTAQFVVGIASTLFMMIFYSFMVRGYGMVCLFFIIALWATYNIINKGNRTKDWLFFTISSMLGFYAVPSFLYPFITLNILILIYNYKNIKYQFIYNTVTVLGVILLYSPIMVVDGVKALVGNNFVLPIERSEVLQTLPSFAAETLTELSHWSIYVILPILLASYIISFRKDGQWTLKGNRTVVLWLVFILTPFVLLVLQSVIPFPRTFVYYGFVLVFLVGISWKEYIDKIPQAVLLISILLIEVASLTYFKLTIGPYEHFNTTGKVINDYILGEPDKTYFLAPTYSISNFDYEYTIRGYDFDNVHIGGSRSLSADTITGYDYVVVEVEYDKTLDKKPIFSNEYQNVYSH